MTDVPNEHLKTTWMPARFGRALTLLTILFVAPFVSQARAQQSKTDPLSSWNEGATKTAILTFVRETTHADSTRFVPPEARIATFTQALYDEAKKKDWFVVLPREFQPET